MWYDYLFSLITVYLVVAVLAAVHVLLNKRNSRAAFGWLGLILVFPIAGALLYALFGVNRVQRKARRIAPGSGLAESVRSSGALAATGAELSRPGYRVTGTEPLSGNSVVTYLNGEGAFPNMLRAIDGARREVLLSSYIFDNDGTGRLFIEKMAAARERGCTVRVLVDDVGIRYSLPTVIRELKRARLPHKRFMPLRLIPPSFSINLRTHRKILAVDREVAFAGGMNIGDRQLIQGPSPHRASDLHFGFRGPLVDAFVRLFGEDWRFAGGDDLEEWTPAASPAGDARCRLISDGPDETLDSLMRVIMGVISGARERVWIMTPYFLPDRQMMGCLQGAALTGVDVQVMIPARNNWPLVQWALQHNMAELLDTGVRVLQRPSPFAHSKCLLVDQEYALVGSSNLDPRSLRLNFELGIEVFDRRLNTELSAHFGKVAAGCAEYSLDRLRARSIPVRLRDGAAALFSPYL
jgi:cardiolipin synthase